MTTRTEVRSQRSKVSERTIACVGPATLAPSPRLRRAFTLVEMVIVIGIIVLLVGLTVAVLGTLTRSSETRRTQDALTLLDSAYQEWKNVSERDITYGVNGAPMAGVVYDIPQAAVSTPPGSNHTDFEPTHDCLARFMKNAQAKDILANINSSMLKQHGTPVAETTLLDAWDTEIVTVFPGRLWVSGFDAPALKDADDTIRTEFENAFGVCVNRRVRFVSAGPDGQFGDYAAADGSVDKNRTLDNLYSYPLETP
jgi:type II secretory pathway pseudopilin PulG